MKIVLWDGVVTSRSCWSDCCEILFQLRQRYCWSSCSERLHSATHSMMVGTACCCCCLLIDVESFRSLLLFRDRVLRAAPTYRLYSFCWRMLLARLHLVVQTFIKHIQNSYFCFRKTLYGLRHGLIEPSFLLTHCTICKVLR